jgi:hypothetical protein
MVRSANDRSWFLKNSVAALADRITMVFIAPSLNQITLPYFCLMSVRVRCGIEPRSNRFPNIGHPDGPGGCLFWLDFARRRSRDRSASEKRLREMERFEGHNHSMA